MEILRAENLTKIYGTGENQVVALDHVSFLSTKANFSPSSGHPVPANPHCFTF